MTADGEFVNIVAEDVDFFDYHYGRKFGYPLVRPAARQCSFPPTAAAGSTTGRFR